MSPQRLISDPLGQEEVILKTVSAVKVEKIRIFRSN
jgi:hypothetical protein